jgi:hypothetical protein
MALIADCVKETLKVVDHIFELLNPKYPDNGFTSYIFSNVEKYKLLVDDIQVIPETSPKLFEVFNVS